MITIFEGVTRFGKPVKVEYEQFGFGLKYRVRLLDYHTPPVRFGTQGEAMKYADKLINGGM